MQHSFSELIVATIWKQRRQQLGSNLSHKKMSRPPTAESFVWRIIGLLFAMFHLTAVLSPLRMMCMCNMPISLREFESAGVFSGVVVAPPGLVSGSMAVGLCEINRAPSRPCFASQISFVNYLESLDQQAHASWPSCWTHHETVNNQTFLMSHKDKNKVDFPLNLCVLAGKSAEQLNCCQRMRTHSGHLFICMFFHSFHLLWV